MDKKITSVTEDRVLVCLTVGMQATPAGIIIPASAQHIEPIGVVQKIGPRVDDVHVGDRVLVDDQGGTFLEESHGERYVLYREKDIIAVLE
jgi:co-chaperonin GroES (HSP10)